MLQISAFGGTPSRAAAGVLPCLDIKDINATSGASLVGGTWSRQQKRVRRTCLDRLRYWQSHGYEVLWVTLTSGVPVGEIERERAHKKLRLDFAELRKRISRKWGYQPFEYVCIETAEGNGVLHMLWALEASKGQFYVPYAWLKDQWEAIHGAWSVWVARVSNGESSRRRLSRYIVTQYCGGQDALVRLSQSRLGFSFGKCRKALLSSIKACTDRYLYYGRIRDVYGERFGRLCGQWYWLEVRNAWNELIEFGVCEFFGQKFCWWGRELCPV